MIPQSQRSATASPMPTPLVGGSDIASSARRALELAVESRTPVLVVGEPGCRPGSIAEALHTRTRHGLPLVRVECGTAGAADLDTRLFGTLPKRTTAGDLETVGADAAIMAAAAGTLFLDNIDELPASGQRRLARVLRDGEVRLAPRPTAVALSFRLVASTTRDLEAEVREGRFRQDLVRRFAACRIVVPPLRQRAGDLAAVIERVVADMGGPPRPFTQPAVTVLAALPWIGNLDELADVLRRILAHAGPIVTQEDVLAHVPIDGSFARLDLTASLREARRRFERDYIAAVLERHQWRMSDAARALGIERANLYRKARQLGIAKASRAEMS
jgi:two-component system, NtrC family, nitrogen regulation response regulator NtrX